MARFLTQSGNYAEFIKNWTSVLALRGENHGKYFYFWLKTKAPAGPGLVNQPCRLDCPLSLGFDCSLSLGFDRPLARGFLNPALISGSLAQSGSEKSKKAAEAAIRKFYQSGAAKRGSALLLPGDLKISALNMDMRQADIAFCKKSSDQELARIMGIQWVTAESLNVQSGAKEAARSLQAVTLKPWLEHCAGAFTAFLLSERERAAGLKFCFEMEIMQSMDGREKSSYLAALLKNGLISQNEGREMLGLPRLAGPEMDMPEKEKIAEAEIKKPEMDDQNGQSYS